MGRGAAAVERGVAAAVAVAVVVAEKAVGARAVAAAEGETRSAYAKRDEASSRAAMAEDSLQETERMLFFTRVEVRL